MRKITCNNCSKADVPQNQSLNIDELDYCSDCIEKNFSDEATLTGKKIVKTYDPTVCIECQTDFGETIIPKLAHYPICGNCQANLRKKTFPLWVKAFLVGIGIIVIFSFCWNWKYYQGYSDIKTSGEFASKGDYSKAAFFMESAGHHVPEVEDIKALTYFYQGLSHLQQDQGEKALAAFLKCDGKLPDNYGVDKLILNAKVGIAFDKRDYEGFLKATKAQFEADSTTIDNWYGVASAYSCLYATKGDEANKAEALHYLNGAKKIDSTSTDSRFYQNMIEYRLITHKMITRQDFKKQFPNGWTKP